MSNVADEKYFIKRNYDFIEECKAIFNKYSPQTDPIIVISIILEIALVRSKMELEYSKDMFEDIKSVIGEAVKGE